MNQTLSMTRVPEADPATGRRCSATNSRAASAACVDSAALLQGQKTLLISHHGETYRLQATRLGKLILTK